MKVKNLLIALCMLSPLANAYTVRNDVPSCSANMPQEYVDNSTKRELFVIIDRTMSGSLNEKVMVETYNQISRFVRSGDSVQIVQFSSYNKDGFTNVAFKGKTDLPLSKENRDYIRKSQLASFDKCLNDQHQFVLAKIGATLQESFAPQENTDFTEVIASVAEISSQIISVSTAEDKVVLLISDMLENSSATSFYHRGSVRMINSQQEVDNVIDRNEFGQFGGARIYVMGAGLLPGGQSYVSSQKMKAIEQFWSQYFAQSNGQLRGFGKPLLLSQFH